MRRYMRGALALLLGGVLLLQTSALSASALTPEWTLEEDSSIEQSWSGTQEGDQGSLFAQYVDRELGSNLFSVPPIQTYSTDGFGSQLDGVTEHCYRLTKQEVEEIAQGNRTSTIIEITPEQLGLGGRFTAEDLGVESIVSNGQFTQEAIDAMYALVDIDLRSMMNALLGDCPLELYWFDKTRGMSMSGPSIRGTSTYVEFSSNIKLNFAVAAEYAVDGVAGGYETDVSKTGIVQTVKDNAMAIVEKYEGSSDWEKLSGYSREICAMVDYNYDAASNPGTPYGNPWQLLWVFDGDPSTKVVCEGYAKAFQYLCELSWFSGDISCYSVTGTMNGGGHMWNLLKMDDGKSYLVDVTNCDQWEYMDWLFLKGCSDVSVYGFTCADIRYVYDDDMQDWFTPAELLMSTTDYVPGADLPQGWIEGIVTSYGDETVQPEIRVLDQQGVTVVDTAEVKDGAYRTHALDPGTYLLEVSKEHHVTRYYTVSVAYDAAICDAKICLIGDVSGDGRVNTLDVGQVNGYVKHTISLTDYQILCGDVNGDGRVNTMDVGKINAHTKQSASLW